MLSTLMVFKNQKKFLMSSARLVSPGFSSSAHSSFPLRNFSNLFASATSPRCRLSTLFQSTSNQRAWASSTRQYSWPSQKSDLLDLRGVGPVNAGLLLAKEITSVEKLQQIYSNDLNSDKEELLRFLSDVVGFRNMAHCRSVADHLEILLNDDGATMQSQSRGKPIIPIKLAVEGNIGAGKSTFLDILQDRNLELQDLIEVVPEPVEEWQRVQNGSSAPINLLDKFYKDPEKYAYTFQHYVLLTRMEKDRKARSSLKPLKVLERSIFSDRLVFVRAMHEAGYMGDLELQLYDSWFSMEIDQDELLRPNGFIYLKALPETCIKRLRNRNRSEEAGVDRAYLENLHDKHESWLHFGARNVKDDLGGMQVQTTSKLRYASNTMSNRASSLHGASRLKLIDNNNNNSMPPSTDLLSRAPASIRDSIVFLGRKTDDVGDDGGEGKVLDVLSGIPALVLDHEQEDILHDLDARRDYAKKVKDFSEFVSSIQETKNSRRKQIKLKKYDLTADQIDSFQTLINEYRRLCSKEGNNSRPGAIPGSSLAAMEGTLARLSLSGGGIGFRV